jgi:hypothetical protein
MDKTALRILKELGKRHEVTLLAAIGLGKSKGGDHVDQYPLALLLEDGFLGMTLSHHPPEGAELSKEYSLATTLHMFGLPKDPDGSTQYLHIVSSGSVDPTNERIFLKAKGALYLDQMAQKSHDRVWSFILGLAGGVAGSLATAWLKQYLKM